MLRVRGLETAPDTIKMAETIIVMPCCAGKSWQPNSTIPFHYVQTKLQSFSNLGESQQKAEVSLSEVQDAREAHRVAIFFFGPSSHVS